MNRPLKKTAEIISNKKDWDIICTVSKGGEHVNRLYLQSLKTQSQRAFEFALSAKATTRKMLHSQLSNMH